MRRIAATLLSLLLLIPSAALAQTERAGVVTTLEGNVTARRVALPDPIPLKFKDDVLLRDTVTTGDKSLARMLLGGKAVVTVRERSVLTITEVPGRSTIELETGKFALAVAREKMRPGEEIQIRTPNAIAGVRGTVVITEVNRQTAQLGRAAGSVLTKFWVLRGNITAQPLDISTRQPVGTPLNIGPMHAYAGAGNAAPRVTPVPPDEVTEITSGLQPSGLKGGSDAGQEQVKVQAVETAVALLGALTGTGGATQMAAIIGPAPTTTTAEQPTDVVTIAPIVPLSPDDIASIPVVFNGLIQFLNQQITLNSPAQAFNDTSVSLSPAPQVEVDHSAISQVLAGLDFVQVGNAASVLLFGPLVRIHDSSLVTPGSLFDMVGGVLLSVTSESLFDIDPSFITAGDALISITGGILALSGPLLTDVGGTLTTAAQLLRLQAAATLINTSPDALIQLNGTTVTNRNFLSATNATLLLTGPFLSASFADLQSGDGTANVLSFLFLADGAQVSSTSPLPFMTFTNSAVDTSGNILSVRRSAASTPTSLTLAGPLLVATDSTFNHTSLGLASQFGGPSGPCCNGFFIGQGGELSSSTSEALIQLTNSTVTGNDAQSGGNFFTLASTFTGAPAGEPVAGGTVTLSGPLLASTNSTITELLSLIFVFQSTLHSTSPAPLITLNGGSATLSGINPFTGAQVNGNLLAVQSSPTVGQIALPSTVTLGGPLFSLNGATFNSGTGNTVSIINGATYTAGGAGAMMQVNSSSLSGFNMLSIGGIGGSNGITPASVTLAGPVLSAINSTMTFGSNVIASFGGSALTSTTTGALVQLVGSSLTAGTVFGGAEVLQVNGLANLGGNPGVATLNGPIYVSDSGSALNTAGALFGSFAGGQLFVNGSTDPLFTFNGGTHLFGNGTIFGSDTAFSLNGLAGETADEIVEPGNETPDFILTLGTRKPVTAAGGLLEMTQGATANTKGIAKLDTALFEATAPMLNMKGNSNLTVANDGIDLVSQAKLTTSAINPLIRLDASTLTINSGHLVAVRGGSFLNIGGDLLAMNNASTLNLNNGSLLLASGGSFVKIPGALVNFGGTGNTINVTNTLCPCTLLGGLQVALTGGAVASNVSITAPITNPGGGTINLTNGSATAHLTVDGAATKVTIGPIVP